ncbi:MULTISPECIES: YozQ family protein [Paenibacillus]|uniref:YozQ family protein n=1 Tax=Paenibacillus TaxID=44249 RepID=UPI0022B8C1D9|nr:YozQ family protein [Paenibacillus caseinilyticus]MCZ8521146.1 YozQ family protein [Paenibacillus caseinilyticus]
MNDKASEGLLNNYRKVAGQSYDVSDYTSSDESSQGTAVTHEQFSDAYTAGTSDGMFQLEQGVVHSPAAGYDEEQEQQL